MQRGRGRQGLLPDFRLQLPSPAGEPEYRLAELKMIGAVAKWYPRSGALARRKSGVERRVIQLPGEYSTPLAKLDRKYHGTAEGQVGPLQRRLEGYGRLQCLVMRTFQEGSNDLHALLETLADSKLRAKGLARGREGTDMERAIILSEFRRELSVTAGKANSACLIGRVARVGEGHRLAAKRRAWFRREEERREDSRRAHWAVNVVGRGVFRGRGNFVTGT